jgi:MerR family mercuric resistance operon transcriptional regulator
LISAGAAYSLNDGPLARALAGQRNGVSSAGRRPLEAGLNLSRMLPLMAFMALKGITIGTLARKAGVNIETIRYYQRRGLLMEPPKPTEGYRLYPLDSVQRILFIKRAQRLGFSLEEIINLLRLGTGNCTETKVLAMQKLSAIETRLEDLEKMKRTLQDLVQRCDSGAGDAECPIVSSLAERELEIR